MQFHIPNTFIPLSVWTSWIRIKWHVLVFKCKTIKSLLVVQILVVQNVQFSSYRRYTSFVFSQFHCSSELGPLLDIKPLCDLNKTLVIYIHIIKTYTCRVWVLTSSTFEYKRSYLPFILTSLCFVTKKIFQEFSTTFHLGLVWSDLVMLWRRQKSPLYTELFLYGFFSLLVYWFNSVEDFLHYRKTQNMILKTKCYHCHSKWIWLFLIIFLWTGT